MKTLFFIPSHKGGDKLLCSLEINSQIREMFHEIYINERRVQCCSVIIYLWLKINEQIVTSLSDTMLS